MRKLLHIVAAMLIASPLLANANWNEAWTAKSKVTIDATAVTAAVDSVPVVIRLHSGNFGFLDAKPDGSDIRFIAADDKTELKYHIEKFDGLNELAIIWVQLPKIDPAQKDAHFWIYYGNETATSTADAKSSWDAPTLAAFHFAEKALLQDSSASGLVAMGEVTVQKAALLGEAAVFAAKPLTIPAVKLGTDLTWSAWIKPATVPQKSVLFSHGDLKVVIEDTKLSMSVGKAAPINGGEIKATVWQHVAVTIAAGKAVLYVNGSAVGNGDVVLAETQADALVGDAYTGEMDEVQLASVARSADWINLAASGQGAESKLLTVITEEGEGEEGGGEHNYMGILVDSLTIDAIVVIAILGVMFAISVWVMYAKGVMVARTDKDNRKFLKRFQDASGDLLHLDKGSPHKHSTLYKLYMAGLREIRKREKEGETLSLSGASMDAIKAAIDADLVRETQRANSGIVLLTIAISGGPFLGLLGTVVGVMITFAAIAAAGDVNVNAIAPGIAAALLATVAGLGVAIPALFGYNYLASRIKNITIEMQIFVDEFVTRVAELHGK
jgi:biopolymer transport protein ExbB